MKFSVWNTSVVVKWSGFDWPVMLKCFRLLLEWAGWQSVLCRTLSTSRSACSHT